jgi:hypothetical protein
MIVSLGKEVMCRQLPFSAVVVANADEAGVFRRDEFQLEVRREQLGGDHPPINPAGKLLTPHLRLQQNDHTSVFLYRGDLRMLGSGLYRVAPLLSEDTIKHSDVHIWLLDQDSFLMKGELENSEPFDASPTFSADEAIAQIQKSFASSRVRRPWLDLTQTQPIYSQGSQRPVLEMQSFSTRSTDRLTPASKVEYIGEGLARDYIYLSHLGLSVWGEEFGKWRKMTYLDFSYSDDQNFQVEMGLQLSSPLSEEEWRSFEQYSDSAQMSRFGEDTFSFKLQHTPDGVVTIRVTFLEEKRRSKRQRPLGTAQ